MLLTLLLYSDTHKKKHLNSGIRVVPQLPLFLIISHVGYILEQAALMAANRLPPLLVFDGEGCRQWSIMMRMLLCSQDLWDLVEKRISEKEDEAKTKDNK